ncbi:hypothetical protein [Paenibacillus nasutitermitis]|uniref:Uncharacterized protein n=1 Tax=Paenibacillus nasutitermitis TaxID=1652958 RepID=A0A916ZE71_9BACL|nr:hypothetical protein [Paenibacillus nasutitermitis]GGD91337.1 hypothetical protein GCM10010911_57550 [Paenibacillus nasutitermitis]
MSMKKKILSVGGVFIVGVLAGSALMYNNSFYHTINDALGKGATQNSIGNVGGVETINVNGMDLETAMKAVQEQRAQLLEKQLQDQIAAVQARNDQIAKLNNYQYKLGEVKAGFPADAKSDYLINDNQKETLRIARDEAGITAELPVNKGELEALVSQVKGQIDALSNSQQMDMLRLQSLSNKRNEAFETMTNFIKKMQDSRSSIIGNMR